ncbi:hypothetical protein JCM8208_006806 [Rhodotorula glutinis]
MSRRTSTRAPPSLRLPPLPTPPFDALALLDADLLPTSLAPPARLRSARTLGGGTGLEGGELSGRARARTGGGSATRKAAARGASEAGDEFDEGWEAVDGHDQAHARKVVILSAHPALVKGEVRAHVGVLVATRRGLNLNEDDVVLEHMPLPTRIGMRLLFHGVDHGRLVNSRRTEQAFKQWSIREGRKFDDPIHAYERITAFIRTYNIDCTQLREPDLRNYPTMNSFFTRRLERGARPPASPRDPTVISSAADCRLTVFSSVADAKRLWIKGKHFTLPALLQDPALAAQLHNGAVAIFRLAVEDYHRFHVPVDAVVGESRSIPGAYFTVNSMVVRDKHFDVFTENKRDVTTLHARHPLTGAALPVAYVQVGALLVASIRRTVREGRGLKRSNELGCFSYGGSTVVCVFPQGSVEWDEDLVHNSEGGNVDGVQVETILKVGERIGRWVDPGHEL